MTFIRISNLPSLSSSHGRGKNLGCGRRWSGKYPMNCHHFCFWLNLFRFQQSDGWDWRGKGCPPLFYCDSSHSHNRITHVALTSYLRQVRNRFESLKEIPETITQLNKIQLSHLRHPFSPWAAWWKPSSCRASRSRVVWPSPWTAPSMAARMIQASTCGRQDSSANSQNLGWCNSAGCKDGGNT